MPAPQEIPGFYFDAAKNRYFPFKGPIPGSRRKHPAVSAAEDAASSSSSHSRSSGTHGKIKQEKGRRVRVHDLLQSRELHGRILMLEKSRCLFKQEYDKLYVSSYSSVWKCQLTESLSDGALEQFYTQVQTPEGQQEINILLMGGKDGSFSLFGVGDPEEYQVHGFDLMRLLVFPVSKNLVSNCNVVPDVIWTPMVPKHFPSSVSSIMKVGGCSHQISDDNPFQNALVTTLGSGDLGGSVYLVKLNEALDFRSDLLGHQRLSKISSHDFTIWTGACDSSGTKAALGTNQGASLLNLETGRLSWLYRSRSDIFSQQFDQSGNMVLCGFRNGSVLAVDVRQKMSGSRLHFTPSGRVSTGNHQQRHQKKWVGHKHQPKGDISSGGAFMPSAVCSLVTLQSDEQYFIGSSMDGSIELFDRRLLHRGSVQSYEGHVNSHSHLELGVDPSESFIFSGGEDCYLRIWSIKSGKLLFSEKVQDSILKTVCWMPNKDQNKDVQRDFAHGLNVDVDLRRRLKRYEVWMGSMEGLFCLKDVA